MAKRLSITIPEDMYARLDQLRDEMGGREGKRKISKICQKAIGVVLDEAEASHLYRLEGLKDGKKLEPKLTEADKNYISRVLSKSGPYKKWSRFEKIEELDRHFFEIKKFNYKNFIPQFFKIMDGKLLLHDWLNIDDEQAKDDRLAEMAWSYKAGCFEGIYQEYSK